MSEDKQFEDLFRRAFEGKSVEPSAETWEKIRKDLNYSDRRKGFLTLLLALLLLLAVSTVWVMNQKTVNPTKQTTLAQAEKSNTPAETRKTKEAPMEDAITPRRPSIGKPVNPRKPTTHDAANNEAIDQTQAGETATNDYAEAPIAKQSNKHTGGLPTKMGSIIFVPNKPILAQKKTKHTTNAEPTHTMPSTKTGDLLTIGQEKASKKPVLTALDNKNKDTSALADSAQNKKPAQQLAANTSELVANTPSEPRKHFFSSLEFYAVPKYTFRDLMPNQSDEFTLNSIGNQNKFYAERMSYEAGARLVKQLRQRLEFTSGLSFALISDNINYSGDWNQVDHFVTTQKISPNIMVVAPTYRIHVFDKISHYLYTGLNVGANYYLLPKLRISSGLSVVMPITGQTKVYQDQVLTQTIGLYSDQNLMRMVNVNFQASLGFLQPLSPRTMLVIEPHLNYQFFSSYKSTEVLGARHKMAGLSIGIRQQIK